MANETSNYYLFRRIPVLLAVFMSGAFCLGVYGCAGLVASSAEGLAEQLSAAMRDQNDPETVKDGAPAYLLLVDGLIQNDPESVSLLLNGARIYTGYAGAFVNDPERAQRLTDRAYEYGKRALCQRQRNLCAAIGRPYNDFVIALNQLAKTDVPLLYTWSSAWVGRIQAHRQDWNSLANLPRVEAAMKRVVELDETFDEGRAHVYLGVLYTLLPATLGGKPAEGKAHFERAIAISAGRDLMDKVMFAKYYARLVFDRKLHDQLLESVLASPADQPGLTLSNTLAKEEARRLLATAAEYF